MDTIRIQIISDSAADVSKIIDLLQAKIGDCQNYIVRSTTDPKQALIDLVRNEYDVFIIDYDFGKACGGLELFSKAQVGGCEAPVIFLVEGVSDVDIHAGFEVAGVAGFINKDLDFTDRMLRHSIRYAFCSFKKLTYLKNRLETIQSQFSDIYRKLS